jgi:hypothetical protein
MSPSEEFEAAVKATAEAFVQGFAEGDSGLPTGALDYSKDSLAALDQYLTKVRAKAPEAELRQAIGLGAGAYLAEVLRRRSPVKLRWVPGSVLPKPSANDPFVLATPKNLVFAVLGKPLELLQPDATDTLARFAGAIVELCSREATQVG